MHFTEIADQVFATSAEHGFEGLALGELVGQTREELDAYRWLNVEAETNAQAAIVLTIIKTLMKQVRELTIDRKLLLTIGELVEAQNELRTGHKPDEIYYGDGGKPEGFGMELADAHIRLMNLETSLGIDGESNIIEKDDYNQTRPYKHGKRF